jgi:hypothetical protein
MNVANLIPAPDPIPAPAWFFLLLDNLLFFIHILLINVVVGGCLLALFLRDAPGPDERQGVGSPLTGKLPLVLPFAITVGVAPLLFMQVVFGTFFYSSSILMANYWIAVIPLLILAYYGIYLHARQAERFPRGARAALWVATLFFLGIAFIYVNNLTLMLQPERWTAYYGSRGGALLNLADRTLFPRYLHFVTASVAVASLVCAGIWQRRFAKGERGAEAKRRRYLRWVALATGTEMIVGFWFFASLPSALAVQFMGRDPVKSLILLAGGLTGIGVLVTAWRDKWRPTLIQLALTIGLMVITRAQLRELYLAPYFQPDKLPLNPQYGVLGLFIVVLIVGLLVIGYMVRLAFTPAGPGGAR